MVAQILFFPAPKTKTCSKCKVEKPLEGFYKQKASSDGLAPWCKGCKKLGDKEYRNTHKDGIAARKAECYLANKDEILAKQRIKHRANPYIKMANDANARARKEGNPSDITPEYLQSLDQGCCASCGCGFEVGKNLPLPNSWSVDAIIAGLGHIRGNLAIICRRCNVSKNDSTLDEYRSLVRAWRKIEAGQPLLSKVSSGIVSYRTFNNSKNRSKKKGLEHTLVWKDLIVPARCPYLGVPLFSGKGKTGPINNSPTIDRIDNSKGYTKENTIICSYKANKMKNDLTLQEAEKVLAYMERETPKVLAYMASKQAA